MLVKMEAEALARGLQLVTSSSALEALRVGGEAGDLGDSGIPSRWHRCQDDDSQEEAANGGGVNDFVINPFSKRPSIYAGVCNPDEEDGMDSGNTNPRADSVSRVGLADSLLLLKDLPSRADVHAFRAVSGKEPRLQL